MMSSMPSSLRASETDTLINFCNNLAPRKGGFFVALQGELSQWPPPSSFRSSPVEKALSPIVLRLRESLGRVGVGDLLGELEAISSQVDLDHPMVVLNRLEGELEEAVRLLPPSQPFLPPDQGRLSRWLGRLARPVSEPARTELGPLLSSTVAQRLARRQVHQDIRRELRVSRAILIAETELALGSGNPPSQWVDDQWLSRWSGYAASFGSEMMLNLWGKILAREIQSPGSFDLRSLDFLHSLSAREASDFARLMTFVVADIVFRGCDGLLAEAGVNHEFLLEMQHLGLLFGVEATNFSVTLTSLRTDRFEAALPASGQMLVIRSSDPSQRCVLPSCKLTPMGRQISQLVDSEVNPSYLHRMGQAIRAQGFDVQLGRIRRSVDRGITLYGLHSI